MLTLILVVVVFVLVRVFSGPATDDRRAGNESVALVDVRFSKERSETEARAMFEHAREIDQKGNTELATVTLNRLMTAYPETKVASEAREAVGRPRQHLPLFSTSPKLTARATNPETIPTPAPDARHRDCQDGHPGARARSRRPGARGARDRQSRSGPGGQQSQAGPVRSGDRAQQPRAPHHDSGVARGLSTSNGSGKPSLGLAEGDPRQSRRCDDGPGSPAGTFIMGREGSEPGEAPAHRVRLSTFYIDKHEVTNRQFDQFVKESGPKAERDRALSREKGGVSLSEDHPAVLVSGREAGEYADWAGKRLPTEAQWEMAARGNDNRLYPWGPFPPNWERPRMPHQIDAVMSFPSDLSPFGAYDMAGNALEWTRDWFDSKYYANFLGTIAEDPAGPSSRPPSSQRTVKGGSRQWIVTAREGIKYDSRLPFLGFRCVLPVEGPDNAFLPPAPVEPVQRPATKAKGGRLVVPF